MRSRRMRTCSLPLLQEATNGLDFGTMTVKPGSEIITCPANKVPAGFEGVDAGPASQQDFRNAIKGAKTILWNGPAGVFECDDFTAVMELTFSCE